MQIYQIVALLCLVIYTNVHTLRHIYFVYDTKDKYKIDTQLIMN